MGLSNVPTRAAALAAARVLRLRKRTRFPRNTRARATSSHLPKDRTSPSQAPPMIQGARCGATKHCIAYVTSQAKPGTRTLSCGPWRMRNGVCGRVVHNAQNIPKTLEPSLDAPRGVRDSVHAAMMSMVLTLPARTHVHTTYINYISTLSGYM